MKIGLNLIMKDEEKVLPRLLESVYPLLDYYTIVDTGSTDKSKQIVKDFFSAKNIPGEIFDAPFTNFSETRNIAISKIASEVDYALIIDSDEQLILSKEFNIKDFKERIAPFDTANIVVEQGTTKYSRAAIFKVSKNFYWKGKVHNALVCDTKANQTYISEEVKIKVNTDGNTWTKQSTMEKYSKQAEILEEEVKKYNRPRDIFYLAQCYKDASNNEQALKWYANRLTRKDGFYEELYYSQFMIGNIYKELGLGELAIFEWMKCNELDELRGEHLVNIIIELQAKAMFKTALKLSEEGLEKYYHKNPYPNRVLFLHSPTYQEKFKELHEINQAKIKAWK